MFVGSLSAWVPISFSAAHLCMSTHRSYYYDHYHYHCCYHYCILITINSISIIMLSSSSSSIIIVIIVIVIVIISISISSSSSSSSSSSMIIRRGPCTWRWSGAAWWPSPWSHASGFPGAPAWRCLGRGQMGSTLVGSLQKVNMFDRLGGKRYAQLTDFDRLVPPNRSFCQKTTKKMQWPHQCWPHLSLSECRTPWAAEAAGQTSPAWSCSAPIVFSAGWPFGWHCLSNATCLIRPPLFYACYVVSRNAILCYFIRNFWRKHVLDKSC